MKKFLVLYFATPAAMKSWKKMSPEDQKKGMAAWMAWKKKNKAKIVTFGNPLGKGATLSKKKTSAGDKKLCGYSIIKSKDLAAAKKILKKHPHITWNAQCSLNVHEIVPMH